MPNPIPPTPQPHSLPPAASAPAAIQGRVVFVGAGPGDPELLTIRARKWLEAADAVVFDALVPPPVLALINPHAKRYPVPREPAADTPPTGPGSVFEPGEAAGRLAAQLASAGRLVVRLKGGDPAVFGRLAEEMQAVRAAGIPYEIVPGVTAALAAAAVAGVPLTNRSSASSLTILTGHEALEKPTGLDFQALADMPGTLAVYMGVEQAGKWSQLLLAAGKPAATPVTIVSRCSWPDQQVAATTLGACAAEMKRGGWRSPAVVLVGEAAAVPGDAAVLPLSGRIVLLGRPAGQGDDLSLAVATLGGRCLQIPTVSIEPPASFQPLDECIRTASTYDWIVFASANGVRAFLSRLRHARLDGRGLGTARLAAIGPATRRALEQGGLICDLEPATYRSEGIVEALGTSLRRGRFLLVRADRGRDVMRVSLEAQGHHVTEVAAYTNRPVTLLDDATRDTLESTAIDWITVTSSSIAEAAVRLFGPHLAHWRIASISPVTSAALVACGFPPTVEASEATSASLAAAMAAWEQAHRQSECTTNA